MSTIEEVSKQQTKIAHFHFFPFCACSTPHTKHKIHLQKTGSAIFKKHFKKAKNKQKQKTFFKTKAEIQEKIKKDSKIQQKVIENRVKMKKNEVIFSKIAKSIENTEFSHKKNTVKAFEDF